MLESKLAIKNEFFRLNIMKKAKLTIKNEDISASCSQLPVAYILEKHRLIEVKAYILAETDNFRRTPDEYWFSAENEIHQKIM